jgi:hypothetical protein
MPIRYELDDARRRVVIIVQDTIEPDHAVAVFERLELWSALRSAPHDRTPETL